MIRLLFVDDEPRILEGLRRMLYGMRTQWDISVAEGAEAALGRLSERPFDAIVTDMRMPGMSGAELLGRVKELYPDIVRIVLSGHADTDLVLQAFGVAQQYLMKPCNRATLQQTVQRAMALRERLGGREILKVVGGLTALPSLPAVYQELVAYLKTPEAALDHVGEIIGGDIAMATAILRVVNSAYFGIQKPITKIERAVSFLGLDTIMTLVLEHGLFSDGPAAVRYVFDHHGLRRHSLATGSIATAIAELSSGDARLQDEALLAGVLHDIGRLVLAVTRPDSIAAVDDLMRTERMTRHAAERAVLQVTHAEVGAYLLATWGFSDSLTEATLFHHAPADALGSEWGLPGIIHVASAMADHPRVVELDNPILGVDLGYLAEAGVTRYWPQWREACSRITDSETGS